MDMLITVASMSVPILTNWLAVRFTHDFIIITFVDLLVMFVVDLITEKLRKLHQRKGYVELESYKSFPVVFVLIVLVVSTAYFIGMHSSAGKYTCGGFQFGLPKFTNPIFGVLYVIVFGLLLLYFLPKVETVFYYNFYQSGGHYFLMMIVSGLLAGAKGYFLIEELYDSCGANIVWIFAIWLCANVFIQRITSRDFEDGLAVRQTVYLCLFIGGILIWSEVSFVKHDFTRADPKNLWTRMVKD